MRRAEQGRRRKRIAQQALQGRAGHSEDGPDRRGEHHARQTDLPHDDLLRVGPTTEQRVDDGERRQPYRSDAERDDRQQRRQPGKRRRHRHRVLAEIRAHHVAVNPA